MQGETEEVHEVEDKWEVSDPGRLASHSKDFRFYWCTVKKAVRLLSL